MDEVMTVDVAMGLLERLEGYGLAVHPGRCVRVRNRHASCARCAKACTSGALAFHDGQLTVDEALCVGCGTCATVCPTCAIEARHPADAELLAAAQRALREADADGESATVTFACHRAFEEAPSACAETGAIELACLSRMDESLAMRLFADGASRIRLLHGTCEGCARENGFASVCLVRKTIGHLLSTWDLTCEYKVCQVPSEAQGRAAQGCESVMRRAAAPLSRSAARKPAHVQSDGTLPHFVPLRRHALLDALTALGDPAQPVLDTRLWGHVTIDMRKCKSCKMCAVFCPTGALQKYQDESGHGGVEHYPAECVHCGLCQDICPAGAIISSTAVPAHALAAGETERYPMPDPAWKTGPDQILRKMTPQIHSREVQHSY